MDITLQRILSLIPKGQDGKYVHGAKAEFARSLGFDGGDIVSMWIKGTSKSYRNYLFDIAAMYKVSVDWLRGLSDDATPDSPAYDEPEIAQKYRALDEHGKKLIAALLALSSLRRSELIHLDWSGVDLKHRRLQVAGADVYDENNRRVSKAENKTEGSRRVVPIMMNQLQEALKAVGKKEGRVVSCAPDTVRRRVNAICRANGLPEIGTHGLRHSFASLAAHLQMPEAIAMEIGGWQNNKIMREIYVHVWQADKDRYKNEMASFYNLQKPAENGNEFGNDE